MSALLNFTTKVPTERTIAVAFLIQTPTGLHAFRLPVNAAPVLTILQRHYDWGNTKHGKPTREQAHRVAWRIVKDWLEAQLALIQTEMVRLDQVMLPYL